MDGGRQIHGWLASRPAIFYKNKGRLMHAAGPPDAAFLFETCQ